MGFVGENYRAERKISRVPKLYLFLGGFELANVLYAYLGTDTRMSFLLDRSIVVIQFGSKVVMQAVTKSSNGPDTESDAFLPV